MEKITLWLWCKAIEAQDYIWGKGMIVYIKYK